MKLRNLKALGLALAVVAPSTVVAITPCWISGLLSDCCKTYNVVTCGPNDDGDYWPCQAVSNTAGVQKRGVRSPSPGNTGQVGMLAKFNASCKINRQTCGPIPGGGCIDHPPESTTCYDSDPTGAPCVR